jgi:diadenosine tetraphosphate (Ap4A) HIT family hydrolase
MSPARSPVAIELFAQWQRVRGGRAEPASRPFSRDWEELLEDAGIASAVDRSEAEADVRLLAQEGLLECKPVRYKAHLIARVSVPLAAEARWCEAFGFRPASDEEARRIREFTWVPELEFLRETRSNIPFDDLRLLHEFLREGKGDRPIVPVKERSLQIFGDEKRLDVLADSALFRDGRLTIAMLRCEFVAEPLAWKRGPAPASGRPVIVVENAATWHSYARWNEVTAQFAAVIYGGGNRFIDGVGFLAEIFRELGGPRDVFYFGDLDIAGLAIPQRAGRRALEFGLPQIRPHLWSYRQLLGLPVSDAAADEWAAVPSGLVDWLGDLATEAMKVFASGRRIAQERVGWEFLARSSHPQSCAAGMIDSSSISSFADVPRADWVASNDLAFAFFDRFPVSVGHALVVTKRMVPHWFSATEEERRAVMDLVGRVKAHLDETLDPRPDGYNVGFNCGEAAGQTVMHLHVHVIPRYYGDMDDPRGGVRHAIPGKGNYLK